MAKKAQISVSTIGPHRAFADALAAGLIARYSGDPLALARGLVLLPNHRSVRALNEAFIRKAADQGLLLPRMVAIGDLELDETAGVALDDLNDAADLPAAIDSCARRLMLARMVFRYGEAEGRLLGMAEAVRLAGDLARTLDQLHVEEVEAHRLADAVPDEVATHWQHSFRFLSIVTEQWPVLLEALGQMDAVERRNQLFDRLSKRWSASPPDNFVVAAGITTSAPAVARLLKVIAQMPSGEVVLPGLDQMMPADEWHLLGPFAEDAVGKRPCESHPQYQLKLLLERMDVAREDVSAWRWGGGRDAPAVRARAIEAAMAPAEATGKWREMPPRERRVSGVRFLEVATPGDEAQAIALALRRALDTPEKTAALVTPDRTLARRVIAHLQRWGIAIDDSAGLPLSKTPAGSFLALLAGAAADEFSPVSLLALLKHPLVKAGDDRLQWLDEVRRLDKALRGPRPATGLAGIASMLTRLTMEDGRHWLNSDEKKALAAWWQQAALILQPLETLFADKSITLPALLEGVIAVAEDLCGEGLWAGVAGRSASELISRLIEHGAILGPVDPTELPMLLVHMMDEVAVRPPAGGHPRLAIYGLIEARIQRADLMILGSLNEGVWPALPTPDPWLAPRIRAVLGLPGLDRKIGLSAHDFVAAMGAPEVLVTRARRDTTKPTIASRFWLRLDAMTGGMPREALLGGWASVVDAAEGEPSYGERPAPCPAVETRPRRISVTAIDALRADPFAFYASRILRLYRRDGLDIEPSPADRGTAVHAVLEKWLTETGGTNPQILQDYARDMLNRWTEHPLLRVLWQPRVLRLVEWVGEQLILERQLGWHPKLAEVRGIIRVGDVELEGQVDRIDVQGNALRIIDYKTGQPPSVKQVNAGYGLQLGLLAWLANEGAFGAPGTAEELAYWRLSGGYSSPGSIHNPLRARNSTFKEADAFIEFCIGIFKSVAADYLLGQAPFRAKLRPEYALNKDYDHLARLDEWLGREGPAEEDVHFPHRADLGEVQDG